MEDKSIVKRGFRYYKVDDKIISSMVDRGYEINENNIIEVKSKDEKQLKADLKSATIEVLAIEAKRYFTNIATSSEETSNPQNTTEWELDRFGIINASNSIFKSDGKPIDDLDGYASKKASELLFLKASEELRFELSYSDDFMITKRSNKSMDRGHELEPLSKKKWLNSNPDWIEIETNMIKSDNARIGASIDLLAMHIESGEYKIIEIKNPKFSNYLKNHKTGYLNSKYKAQVQVQMLITGIHKASIVIDYPAYKQQIAEVELDIEFCVNAMQTHKRYLILLQEYIELTKELKL
jgi:hypothetical protein